MASIHTVFDALVDNPGCTVIVDFLLTYQDYETARTNLVHLWMKHKNEMLRITDLATDVYLASSLCGNWNEERGQGEFFLGKSRRKSRNYAFSILVEEIPAPAVPAINDESISSHANAPIVAN